jgi:hypothetical protein
MTGKRPHFVRWPTLTATACITAAMGAFACTGQVGSVPSGTGAHAGSPSGGGTTANPGTGGTTVIPGGGNTGAGAGAGGMGQLTPLTLDTGRTVIRRLNRTEYTLTIRDLLGTSATPGDKLPADEIAEGFDTVGEHLSFSLLHAEGLEGVSSALIDELFGLPATDPRRTKVLVCALQTGSEATCARQILTTFTRRAYRRPATPAEVNALMALVDKVRMGGTYTDGLKAALTAALLSPHFFYKEETSIGVGAATVAKPLNAFELATRLSYFLWSRMPDDALAASADSGKLINDTTELSAQVDRMLAHANASALTTSFATRWLTLYRLDTVQPDAATYPSYDDALRVAAQQETTTFFSKLITDNLPLATLINADFTYANARLARHYGLPVTGDAFTRVSLAGTPRAGLLTQTSFLMGNAHPDRSSPVHRGDWVLDRILCAATPPPPDNMEIPPLPPPTPGISGRDFLKEHRENPNCAGCHNVIDPIGLGFENFDGIGTYRTMDSGVAIDSSGTYLGGGGFTGASELAQLISQDPRYAKCVTKQFLTYAIGRPFSSPAGLTYARALAEHAMAAQQGKWRSWIAMIVSSEAFRTNRTEPQ